MNAHEMCEFRHKLDFIFRNFPKREEKKFEFWADGIRHEITLRRECTYSFMYIKHRCFDGDQFMFLERYAIHQDYVISDMLCFNERSDAQDRLEWNMHKLFYEGNLIDYQDILAGLNLIMVEVL